MRKTIKGWKIYTEPEEEYSLILYKSFSWWETVQQMLERLYSKEFKINLYSTIFFTTEENLSDDEIFELAQEFIESDYPKPKKNRTIIVKIVQNGFEIKQSNSTTTETLEDFINNNKDFIEAKNFLIIEEKER